MKQRRRVLSSVVGAVLVATLIAVAIIVLGDRGGTDAVVTIGDDGRDDLPSTTAPLVAAASTPSTLPATSTTDTSTTLTTSTTSVAAPSVPSSSSGPTVCPGAIEYVPGFGHPALIMTAPRCDMNAYCSVYARNGLVVKLDLLLPHAPPDLAQIIRLAEEARLAGDRDAQVRYSEAWKAFDIANCWGV